MRAAQAGRSPTRRGHGVHVALLVAAVLLAAACGPERLALQAPERGYGPDDYTSVRRHWTQRGQDYHNVIDGRLLITATYYSPAFRAAWLARAEEAFGWDGASRTQAAQESQEEARRYHVFFVAMSTASWSWNRLDRRDGLWHVWLSDDAGRSVKPEKVTRIRAKRPEYREFFPYFDAFTEGYLLHFPRLNEGEESAARGPLPQIGPGTREFSLRVTGAPAEVSLTWSLQ